MTAAWDLAMIDRARSATAPSSSAGGTTRLTRPSSQAYADHAAPLIPKDTILRVTGYFDTTAANKNVADGRNWSGLGHRSIDQMLINLTQGIYLTEEQFAQELAERRQVLDLQPGEYVLGCPGCGEIAVETSAGQDQQ